MWSFIKICSNLYNQYKSVERKISQKNPEYSRVHLQRSPRDSRSYFIIGIFRYKRNNVDYLPFWKSYSQTCLSNPFRIISWIINKRTQSRLKINYILFPFCPADAAIVATIPVADICMIYWQHLTPKSTCLQSPCLLLVHNIDFSY
jgi:hypothetical protein